MPQLDVDVPFSWDETFSLPAPSGGDEERNSDDSDDDSETVGPQGHRLGHMYLVK